MRNSRIIMLVTLSIFLVGCARAPTIPYEGAMGGRGQGFRLQPYKCLIDQPTCIPGEISGQVTKITLENFEWFAEPGLAMEVHSPAQGLVHVHLGPLWLLERHMAGLKKGDEVTLQTFCYNLAGKERLLAGEVTHKGNTLKLMDSQGKPYWEAR